MDYSEKWGVDVEEAVKLALIDLKLSRDEVEVTILEEPSKGFFGIGSKLAKVRVEKKKELKEEPVPETVKEKPAPQEDKAEKRREESHTKENKHNKKNRNRKDSRKENKSSEKKDAYVESSLNIEIVDKNELKDVEEHEALDFLKDITEKMGLSLVAPPTITIISPEANLSRVPAWPTFSPLNLCFISLRLEKDVTSSPLSIRIMENSLPIFCHNLINESVDPFPFNVGVVLNEPEYRSILGLKDLCKPTLDKA